MMKRIATLALFLFFVISNSSYAYQMGINQIIWQPDPTLAPSSLSASVDFSGVDQDSFLISLTNTSTLSNPSDFPAAVLLTGIGFNLPITYDIISGAVAGTNQVNFTGDPSPFWGYDNNPLNSGPFLNVTTLSVDTAVSTLSASVETPFQTGGNVNGPKHGIMSAAYSHHNYPYFDGTALITVNLNQNVSDWNAFFATVNRQDVVVSFGSPTAPVPEPATMLLFGTGLIGLVGFRKKFLKA